MLDPRYKVFLSHSGGQKDFVEQLCVDLERHDRYPFFETRMSSLPMRTNFSKLIFKAIEQCKVGVVLLSEEYFMQSKWPMLELVAMTSNPKLVIIPVFLGISLEQFRDPKNCNRWLSMWHGWAQKDKQIGIEEWCATLKALGTMNSLVHDGESEVNFREKIVKAVCDILPETRWMDSHVQGRSQLYKIFAEVPKDIPNWMKLPQEDELDANTVDNHSVMNWSSQSQLPSHMLGLLLKNSNILQGTGLSLDDTKIDINAGHSLDDINKVMKDTKIKGEENLRPPFVLGKELLLRRRPKHQEEFLHQYPWRYRREMPSILLRPVQFLLDKYICLPTFEEMCSAHNMEGDEKSEFGRGRLTATLFPEAFLYHLQSMLLTAIHSTRDHLHILRTAAELVVNDLPYEEGQSFKFFDEVRYGAPIDVGTVFSLGGLVAICQNIAQERDVPKGGETNIPNEYCIVQHDLTGTYLRRSIETNTCEQSINENAIGFLGVKVTGENVHVDNMRDDGSYYSGTLKDFSNKFLVIKNEDEPMNNQCATKLFGHLKGAEFLGREWGLKCSPLLIIALASATESQNVSLTWNITHGHMEVGHWKRTRLEGGEWQILYTNKINHLGVAVEWGMDQVMAFPNVMNPQTTGTSNNSIIRTHASIFGNAVQQKRAVGFEGSFGGVGFGGSCEHYGSEGKELADQACKHMTEWMRRENGGFLETQNLDAKHVHIKEKLLQGTLHQAPHNYLVVRDNKRSDHVSIYWAKEDDKLEFITDILLPGGKKEHKKLFECTLKGLYLKVERDGSKLTSSNLGKPGTDVFSRFRQRIEGKGIKDSMKEVPELGSTSNNEWKHIIGDQEDYFGCNKFWWEATYTRAMTTSRTKYSSGAMLTTSTTIPNNNTGKIGHCERVEFGNYTLIHDCQKVVAEGKFSKPPASLLHSTVKWGGLRVQEDLC